MRRSISIELGMRSCFNKECWIGLWVWSASFHLRLYRAIRFDWGRLSVISNDTRLSPILFAHLPTLVPLSHTDFVTPIWKSCVWAAVYWEARLNCCRLENIVWYYSRVGVPVNGFFNSLDNNTLALRLCGLAKAVCVSSASVIACRLSLGWLLFESACPALLTIRIIRWGSSKCSKQKVQFRKTKV